MPIGLVVSTLLPIILSMLGSGLATFRALPRANQVERLKAALSSNAFWAAGPVAVAAARTAARSDATLNALVAAIGMGGGTALAVAGAAATAKYGVKTNGVHIVKKRRKNCGGDCGCAPCQSARSNPTSMAFRNRKPAARRNGIKFRAGETEFIHAAARVITDAHLTHKGLRVYAVADYGPGRAMLYTTHRTGRLYAPERGEAMIGSLTMNGPAMDLRVPSETLHAGIVDALDAAGAFDPRRNPAGVGYGVAALLGAAGFVAGAYAESALGLTQQFKGRKAAPAPAPRVLTTDAEWVSEEGKKQGQREYSRMIRGSMYYILTAKDLSSRRGTVAYLDRGDGTRIKPPSGHEAFSTLAAAKKAAEADAATRQNPTSMAFRNRALRNHHIRVGGTFYTPGGRKGTVLAESRGGYYRVRWSDGTLGSVRDTEETAYPTEGSRANPARSPGYNSPLNARRGPALGSREFPLNMARQAIESAQRLAADPDASLSAVTAAKHRARMWLETARHRPPLNLPNPAHSLFSRPLLNFESQGTFEGRTAWWINAGNVVIGELSRQRPFGRSGLRQFSRQSSLPYEWHAEIDGTHLTIPDGSTLAEAKKIVIAAYTRKNPNGAIPASLRRKL